MPREFCWERWIENKQTIGMQVPARTDELQMSPTTSERNVAVGTPPSATRSNVNSGKRPSRGLGSPAGPALRIPQPKHRAADAAQDRQEEFSTKSTSHRIAHSPSDGSRNHRTTRRMTVEGDSGPQRPHEISTIRWIWSAKTSDGSDGSCVGPRGFQASGMEYLNAILRLPSFSADGFNEPVAEFSTPRPEGWHNGTDYPLIRFFPMPKEPITVPKPEPADPTPAPPVKDPQPIYRPGEAASRRPTGRPANARSRAARTGRASFVNLWFLIPSHGTPPLLMALRASGSSLLVLAGEPSGPPE